MLRQYFIAQRYLVGRYREPAPIAFEKMVSKKGLNLFLVYTKEMVVQFLICFGFLNKNRPLGDIPGLSKKKSNAFWVIFLRLLEFFNHSWIVACFDCGKN